MKIDVIKISSALSDPIRHRILLLIINHERGESQGCCASPSEGICNCDIVSSLGLIQSKVSYHMKELVSAEIVSEEAKGKWKFYSLNRQTLREYIKQVALDYNL